MNFANGIGPDAEAITFTLPAAYAESNNAGLRIVGGDGHSRWRVLYAEDTELGPGEDQLILKKVKAQSGPEALMVAYYHSAAGTTTEWKVVFAQRDELRSVESHSIRDKVLKRRNSVFGGYNDVRVDRDMIIETIPMYSEQTARCCPDRPTIEMRVRFTGKGLKLYSVREAAAGK